MTRENDLPENERESNLKDCEHLDSERETAAIADSARILDRWEESDPLTREHMLDRVGREMMTVHETPPPELQEEEMAPLELGRYIDQDFRIEINQDLLNEDNPKDGLETYLHEFRHAEQAYEVQKSHGSMAGEVNTLRAAALEANQGEHYISPQDGFADYEQQITEADARQFAERTANRILEERDAPGGSRRSGSTQAIDADEVATWRLAAENGPEK